MRTAIVIVLSAALVAACGQAPRTGPAPGESILYVAVTTPDGPAVDLVGARTHGLVGHLPLGVPSAGWKHYYLVSGAVLEDVDPLTGSVQRTLPLPASTYRLPIVTGGGMPGGLSQDGRRLVLQEQSSGVSHLLVVQTSFAAPPVRIDLPGDFQFDAISNDGIRVYLIQHADGGHYFVRDYNMGSGLDPNVIFDKTDGSAAMSGVRLMGVAAPGGSTLYSVYARADQSAFVHELSLDAPFAVCADLPGPGYTANRSAMSWTLALSPGDDRLIAANTALGIVTEVVSPGGQARTVRLGGGATNFPGGATFTPDADKLIVAGAGGIRWLDVSTLRTLATALPSWTVAGIALSADGKTLYAVSGTGEIAELDGGGAVVDTFDAGIGSPIAVLGLQAVS